MHVSFEIDQLLVFSLHHRLESGYSPRQEGGSMHTGKLLAQFNPWHVVDFSSDIFLAQSSLLAYSRHTGNLNWPIRIQQAGKTLLSWCQCRLTEKALKSGNWRRIYKSQKPYQIVNRKNMKHFVSPSFQFGAKSYSLAVRQVSPGRIIVVWLKIKYAVPRQIKHGILKLTIRRGQSNFQHCLYFCELQRKRLLLSRFGRTVWFECCSYCGRNRRVQYEAERGVTRGVGKEKYACLWSFNLNSFGKSIQIKRFTCW